MAEKPDPEKIKGPGGLWGLLAITARDALPAKIADGKTLDAGHIANMS